MRLYPVYLLLGMAALLFYPVCHAQVSGIATPVIGSQGISINTNSTNVVCPALLCPGSGLLSQSGIVSTPGTNNTNQMYVYYPQQYNISGGINTLDFSNNYTVNGAFYVSMNSQTRNSSTLLLCGSPPLDSYQTPLAPNVLAYNSSNQPTTYYVLVTGGTNTGARYTVISNTTNSITIGSGSDTLGYGAISQIALYPYWSLSSLFPASQATISFIPTISLSNIMTTLTVSPSNTVGTNAPQNVGATYYFNAQITNWVNKTNPSLSAADTIIPPGAYVYLKNIGASNYPLNVTIPGIASTNTFLFSFTTSPTNVVITYFGLPRNTPYLLSQIGFNSNNFTPSPSAPPPLLSRYDKLIIDNGHGDILATYYSCNNKWYALYPLSLLPTNPVFQPGTVFGVVKIATNSGARFLTNYYNFPVSPGIPVFNPIATNYTPAQGVIPYPINTGGD